MKLPFSELFYSIQGEGMFTGQLSVFLRVSGCNLRCWWCDTPYTSWNAEKGSKDTMEIMGMIAVYPKANHVVITGGEPMLYPEAVAELITMCHKVGKFVTIETNGTRYDEMVKPDLWSVSPKLLTSAPNATLHQAKTSSQLATATELHQKNIKPVHLSNFYLNKDEIQSAQAQFKFVVTCKQDVEWVLKMVEHHQAPRSLIWLMPEGRTRDEVLDKSEWVVELCKKHGFNFSTRVHTLIWGHRRGV